jgi:carboxyl-terminal processing protease
MIRPFRLVATLAALAAVALGASARLHRAEAAPGVPVAYRGAAPSPVAAGEDPYQADRVRIFAQAMNLMYDHYVDPTRIQPRRMLIAALENVEKAVAEVMVQPDEAAGKVTITVGSATRTFDVSGVDSVEKVTRAFAEHLAFVREHLVSKKEVREIQYAAANGMLQTLDPHSVLLEPKYFKEMKIQTRGEFGGLGFVIAMRDGNLTVVKVLKNTPAQRAGIRGRDHIMKIEDVSTINMDLQDAVDRLRGRPHTKVAITVNRPGWPAPRRMVITRDMISVETVPVARLLPGNVGYVRVTSFSGNTTRDVVAALNAQRAEAGGRLSGLVLDLRGNPGGLLDQAVQMSDLFLSEGVIVKTVGSAERRKDVNEASAQSSDLLNVPLVVLVNNQSASASEIVAGALKNNGRALVVGRQTFGKGSVQMLYDFAEPGVAGDEAALKLTVAQYLTPGDVSIQETGVAPDVLLLPGRALPEQVNMFAPPRSIGEADLDAHFGNPTGGAAAPKKARPVEQAALEVRYLLPESEDDVAKRLKREAAGQPSASPHGDMELTPEQIEDEEREANPDEFVEDYPIRFSRELLVRAPHAERAKLLDAAGKFVAERKKEESARLEERLEQLGVNWDAGAKAAGTPRAVVTVTPGPGKPQKAGESVSWSVTVENRGDAPFRRLRAWTVSEKNPLLDRREFVFGTVKPGEKRTWAVPVKLPRSLDSRRDEVTLHFEDEAGKAPPEVVTAVDVVEVPKPLFAFNVQVDDARGGNGDGLPQRGETFTLRVDVRNAGPGASGDKTTLLLKNLGDEKLFITKGREVLGAMRPGEVKPAALQVELRRGSQSETLPIRLTVTDDQTGEYVSEKLDLPVAKDEPAREPASGAVRIEVAEAQLRTGASPSAPVLATARKGAVLPVDAKVGDYWRVEWQKGRFAFLAEPEGAATQAQRQGTSTQVWQREPPRIALVPDPLKGAPVVDGDTFRLQGVATVPPSTDPAARLRDVFVFVNDQKVFFKVVPDEAAAQRMEFAADVPLQPGNNVVTVFAREDEEFQSTRSLVIFRKAPPQVAAETRTAAPPPARP